MSGKTGLSKSDNTSDPDLAGSPDALGASDSKLGKDGAQPAEQTQQSSQLTQHSPAKEPAREASVVVAEAAHELRLPIANIKLLVETLLDGALDDREVCKRMLKRAHQEVDRLQALVSDLLALEQVGDRRNDLKCEWLSLKERASYAVESVSKQALEKQIKVLVEIDEGLLIYANKGQLDQVLLNLLENAVKFTNAGGEIGVRGGEKAGTFRIEDTGIGIPAVEIPKIFSKFYRVDKSISKGGTGLGLSIVKQVLDLHGAKITVKSQEGAGSCFELEFPTPRSGGRT